MRLQSVKAAEACPELLKKCRSLSFRGGGDMCAALRLYKNSDRCLLTTAHEGDLLLGWSVTYQTLGSHEFMVYVRSSERRRGVGKKLLEEAKARVRRPLGVYPHDERSWDFYREGLYRGDLEVLN